MHYSRRDFLKVAAAGLAVPTLSLSFSGTAHAAEKARGGYTQARADEIHDRSMEEAIRQTGEIPAMVKARVNNRLRELRQRGI